MQEMQPGELQDSQSPRKLSHTLHGFRLLFRDLRHIFLIPHYHFNMSILYFG